MSWNQVERIAVQPRWGDVVMAAIGGCFVANAALLLLALFQRKLWRRRTKAGQTEAERCLRTWRSIDSCPSTRSARLRA